MSLSEEVEDVDNTLSVLLSKGALEMEEIIILGAVNYQQLTPGQQLMYDAILENQNTDIDADFSGTLAEEAQINVDAKLSELKNKTDLTDDDILILTNILEYELTPEQDKILLDMAENNDDLFKIYMAKITQEDHNAVDQRAAEAAAAAAKQAAVAMKHVEMFH